MGAEEAGADFISIDDYIAAQPEAARDSLQRVRAAIRTALPGAEEAISYKIPAYKSHGRAVIYFAGWKKHYSIYPVSEALIAAFGPELSPYAVEKGTIRFPFGSPVPEDLIRRIAGFRGEEVTGPRARKATPRRDG
jgi:uncharacterized protein YdhG (YjbR/CyaY superfamily)